MSNIDDILHERISDKPSLWKNIVWLHVYLAYEDRIGRSLPEVDGRPPGIWGTSYVRTYYDWTGNAPEDSTRYEGGIATSHYVFMALSELHDRFSVNIDPEILKDLAKFFIARTNRDGIGVYGTDLRGTAKVQANLRHTCQGFILAHEASLHGISTRKFETTCNKVANIIAEPINWDQLLNSLFGESWPIGGVSAYIAARDIILRKYIGDEMNEVARVWGQVKRDIIDLLVTLTSRETQQLCKRAGQDLKDRPLDEHFPWWEPIKGLPVLRLHSTLGCLHLIGDAIGKTNGGARRLNNILHCLAAEVLNENGGIVSFAPGGQPSIAAACSMLDLLLTTSSVCNIVLDDSIRNLAHNIISYIEDAWANPEHYQDYWSEFCIPFVSHKSVCSAIGGIEAETKGEIPLCGIEGLTVKILGDYSSQSELSSIADAVSTVALNKVVNV